MSTNPARGRTLIRSSFRRSSAEASSFLDWTTILGGALLTGMGLRQNGLRGWLPISLGTRVLYRGIIGLTQNRLRESSQAIGNERDETILAISGVEATCEMPPGGDPAARPD